MIFFHPGDLSLSDWLWVLFGWGIIALFIVFHIVVFTYGIKKLLSYREKKSRLKNDSFRDK
jgi:Na+/H+ antiporter NhaD/arsenite permease-like protein